MTYTLKLEQFELYLYEEEYSLNTIKKYIRDVKLLFQYMGNQEISKQVLIHFKEFLNTKYVPTSVNSMLASVNKFLVFMDLGGLRLKPIRIQKEIFARPETELTHEEYNRLIDVAQSRKNERLEMILQTFCTTGIRVSELEYITVNALKTGKTTVLGKGKQRIVLLPKGLCTLLKAYCKKCKITEGVVFRTKFGNPLDRTNIWKMMKGLCKEAKVLQDKVFPHNLRHLFARTYYEIKKDINKLADILGHSDINTTRIYTMETGKLHARQMDKISMKFIRKNLTT